MKNTQKLQEVSVEMFMLELGYIRLKEECFGRLPLPCRGLIILSWQTAIALHNGQIGQVTGENYWHGPKEAFTGLVDWLGVSGISVGIVEDAYKARLVKKAKLQYDKSKRKVMCQSHVIEFNSEEVK